MEFSKGNWKMGISGTVVTDNGDGFNKTTGHSEIEYYGGYLIAESISKHADAQLMAAAPEMLDALMCLENDDKSIPKPIWDNIQKVISKALGK